MGKGGANYIGYTGPSARQTRIHRTTSWTLQLLVAVAAVNVIVLLICGSYDIRFGPLHLVAHGLFKPLLILNGAFLLCVLARKPEPRSQYPWRPPLWLTVVAVLCTFAISCTINPLDEEWTYRRLSMAEPASRLFSLFLSPEISASWYRPLGFLSLWIDSRIWGAHLWAYHLQNILCHLTNTSLALCLARRLEIEAAEWSALLFGVAAVVFEPVMWPAARFDLMAGTFTLLAIIASIDYLRGAGCSRLWIALGSYLLGLLSKESAYGSLPVMALLVALPSMKLRIRSSRWIVLLAGMIAVTAASLAVRYAVLGGIGGYHTEGKPSLHLALGAGATTVLLTRVLPLSLFGVSVGHALPFPIAAAVATVAVVFTCAVFTGAGTASARERILPLCGLAAALPVAAIIAWVTPSLQQARYLYMPALFVAMIAASALSRTRQSVFLLAALALANASGAVYNVLTYR